MKVNAFKILVVLSIVVTIISCKNDVKNNDKTQTNKKDTIASMEEALYRPKFHFTPKANWMNDPNGMFYYNGYYHLYFQYYPDGNVWGPMHWGHAISTDLITWIEKPIALYPDENGYIFSGSAVVDANNTSGFGKDGKIPIIAMFTYHNMEGEKAGKIDYQTQGIAYSLDEGLTWTKYEKNPVIKNPGIKDFRDTKVIWDELHKQWLMVLAAQNKTMFYASKDLKDWKLLSNFGENSGSHAGVWECPDFFPMQIEGTEDVKWVLLLSINPGAPNGGSGTQYFVGDFDGTRFALDKDFEKNLDEEHNYWLDFGRDNYAGVTWSNIPDTDGRRLFIGWMSNWDYAQKVPTEKWRSAMTIARELKLEKHNGQFKIVSQPVKELQNFVSKTIKKDNLKLDKETVLVNNSVVDFSSLDIQIKLKNLSSSNYTFSFSNKAGDVLKFGLNNKDKYFFIDRTLSGKTSFSEKFASTISKAPIDKALTVLDLRVILDKTSIEIFYNNEKIVMTEIFFPNSLLDTFSVNSENNAIEIENLVVKQLKFN